MLAAKTVRFSLALFVLISLLSGLCSGAIAGEKESIQIELNQRMSGLPLGNHMMVFEDSTAELSIDEILSPNNTYEFTRSVDPVPGYGYTNSAYWLKLEILADELKEDWLLEIAYAPLDRINVYFIESNGNQYIEKVAGDGVPYENRDVEYHHAVFQLPKLSADPQVVYLRIESESSMQLPIALWPSSAFTSKMISETLMWGVYFGCLLIMGVYNLFLCFSVREKVYAYYAFYVFSIIAFQLTVHGISSKYLWPEYPAITNPFLLVALNLIGIFAALFSKDFLRLRQHSTWMNGLINASIFGFGLLIVVSYILPYILLLKITIVLFSAGIITLTFSGAYCWKKGYQAARIYLAAWLTLLLGALLYSLKTLGIVPSNMVTNYSVTIGSTLEVMLLSLALGDRINQEIESKNSAQKSSILNLRKYEGLYEEAIEGLFQYSLADRSIKCNVAMANLCGFKTTQEFVGSNYWNELSNASSYKKIEKLLFRQGELKDEDILINNEYLLTPRWCSLSIRLLFNDAGKPERIEGILIDISERKLREEVQGQNLEAQNQLLLVREEALSNLHKADDLKNEFMATLSHELRTPMNGILGCVQLLESHQNNPDAKEAFGGLEKSSAEMIGLVNRLLDFTEIQSGKYELQEKSFSLPPVLDQILYLSNIRCKEKGIVFSLNTTKNVPAVLYGDQEKIVMMLENLIDNAIRFTNSGSVIVTVSAEVVANKVAGKDTKISVSVMDTGIGISKESKDEIFSMFTQAKGGMDRNHGGLGLGLSLCQRYAELMGGELTFTTEQGRGSEFVCSIPLKAMPDNTVLPEKMEFQCAVRSASILVVEDNKTNQLVLLGILKKLGHTAEVANNGAEALGVLACKQFDLILMDCQMPVMDGLEATRQIRRNNEGNKNTPIIAITANAMSGDRQRCLTAGMNDYIKKPFKKEILNEKINLWLQHMASNYQNTQALEDVQKSAGQ